jgi:hypothetical protein
MQSQLIEEPPHKAKASKQQQADARADEYMSGKARQSAGADLLVLQDFAALHGTHDGCIYGVAAVSAHVLHHPLALIRGRPRDLQCMFRV